MINKTDEFSSREYFHIAVIIGVHGLRGELRAKQLSPETMLDTVKNGYLISPDEQEVKAVEIRAKRHKNIYIVRLEGAETREDAEALRSYYLAVSREAAAPLEEGRYYSSDLIGCFVYTEDRGEIGVLKDTISNTGADILLVERNGLKDLLVPILADTIVSVDVVARRIDLKLTEGLWDIYE